MCKKFERILSLQKTLADDENLVTYINMLKGTMQIGFAHAIENIKQSPPFSAISKSA